MLSLLDCRPSVDRVRGLFGCRVFVSTLVWGLILGVGGLAQAKSLEPKLMDDESYGESYTAIADLEDGSYVLLQYVFTNAGLGDAKAACRGLFVPAEKKGTNKAVRVDRDEWSYTKAGNKLTVGKCSLSAAGGKTRFVVRAEGLAIDLSLGAAPRSTKPPGHRITAGGDEFYEAEILVPWAKAQVRVSGRYGKVSSAGMGYLDHTRSNTRLPKIASRWLRFRGFSGAKKTLVEVRYSPSGKARGWIWAEGTSKPVKLNLQGLTLDVKNNLWRSPEAVRFSFGSHRGQSTKALYRYRPAKEWGLLGTLAKPWVGDPEILTYQATLQGPDGTVVSGILELALITK